MFLSFGRIKSNIFSRRRAFTFLGPARVDGDSGSEIKTRFADSSESVISSRLISWLASLSIAGFINAFAGVGALAFGGGDEKACFSSKLYTYGTLNS